MVKENINGESYGFLVNEVSWQMTRGVGQLKLERTGLLVVIFHSQDWMVRVLGYWQDWEH